LRQFQHAIWSDHYSQRGAIGGRLRCAAVKSRGLLRETLPRHALAGERLVAASLTARLISLYS
jgi:hypothetical protein